MPGAAVSLTRDGQTLQTKSGPDGRYAFSALVPGDYLISATAEGFAPLTISTVSVAPGQVKELNLPLVIAVQRQEVTVEGQAQGVSINPDRNAGAMVLQGSDLDALSDDPTELQNELQALAGPAAGPNGGQIYIDGFEGGQIPPKSSILQVRVNENPFSAEFDRIGYGRIEIITKPGSQKLQGGVNGNGVSSAFDTANPLVSVQPGYYIYSYMGSIRGPINKTSAYFISAYIVDYQNQADVDAVNPANLSQNITEAFPAPGTVTTLNPRVDFELTRNNFISIRDTFHRATAQGVGVGTLDLPQQNAATIAHTNQLQIADTWVINPHLLMEPNFLWRRINLAPPNGVLLSPLFNKSQSLAGGPFGNPVSGIRTIVLQSTFSF